MAMRLNPYLNFPGTAREAMEHYRDVFGGELVITTFGEFGEVGTPLEHQVMHAQLDTTAGFTLMASDAPTGMELRTGNAVTVIVHGDDEATIRGYWDGLTAGGTVDTALEQQMWGDLYGQCTDRFGVTWQVNIAAAAG
jgi:PhnB protein